MRTHLCRYLLCLMLVLASIVWGDYRIVWSTVDGGGGVSRGGPYTLTGSIGQADAGYHGGGQYELLAGFWVGGPLCIVNMEDFAQFASYWLDGSCSADNNWCGGADLNASGSVNSDDFSILFEAWLSICPYAWPLK